MSTRSFICKELPYTEPTKIDELLVLGDLSCLAPNLEFDSENPKDYSVACCAYSRDYGEDYELNKPRVVSLRNARKSDIQFMYVFGLDGKWRYINLWEKRSKFQDVQEALQKEKAAEM